MFLMFDQFLLIRRLVVLVRQVHHCLAVSVVGLVQLLVKVILVVLVGALVHLVLLQVLLTRLLIVGSGQSHQTQNQTQSEQQHQQ